MLNRNETQIKIEPPKSELKNNELDILTRTSNVKITDKYPVKFDSAKFDPEDMIKNLSKMNSSYEILKNGNSSSTDISTVNVPGKSHAVELKAMISNALRFHNSVNHDIKNMTMYNFYVKFSMNNNDVVINELMIAEKFDESIVPESSMNEKYNEYDALINDKIKPNKTIKNRFKQMFSISK